jgi:hypothetical protein
MKTETVRVFSNHFRPFSSLDASVPLLSNLENLVTPRAHMLSRDLNSHAPTMSTLSPTPSPDASYSQCFLRQPLWAGPNTHVGGGLTPCD